MLDRLITPIVATWSYAPCAIFCYVSPMLAIACTGTRMMRGPAAPNESMATPIK
jgi:hypothetical protein